MKKLILIVSVIILGSSMFCIAQSKKTSNEKNIVNIKQFVDRRLKEFETEGDKVKYDDIKKINRNEAFISKDTFIKVFLFVEGSIFIVLVLLTRRKRMEIKKAEMSVLKENIRRLRSEKIGSLLNNRLYGYRKKLRLQPLKIDGREITKKAKQMSISKGEIFLAAKLNAMMNNSR